MKLTFNPAAADAELAKVRRNARAGEVPVWQWTERGPLFTTAQLDAWQEQAA